MQLRNRNKQKILHQSNRETLNNTYHKYVPTSFNISKKTVVKPINLQQDIVLLLYNIWNGITKHKLDMLDQSHHLKQKQYEEKIKAKIISIDMPEVTALLARKIFQSAYGLNQLYLYFENELLESYNEYQEQQILQDCPYKIKCNLFNELEFQSSLRDRYINCNSTNFQQTLFNNCINLSTYIKTLEDYDILILKQLAINILVLERKILLQTISTIQPIFNNPHLPIVTHETIYNKNEEKTEAIMDILIKIHKQYQRASEEQITRIIKNEENFINQNEINNKGFEGTIQSKYTKYVSINMQSCYPSFIMQSQQLIQIIGEKNFHSKFILGQILKNIESFYKCHICCKLFQGQPDYICNKKIPAQPRYQSMYDNPYIYGLIHYGEQFYDEKFIHPYCQYYQNQDGVYLCNRAFCQYCYDNTPKLHDQLICGFCQKDCLCFRCNRFQKMIKMMAYYMKHGGNLSQIQILSVFPQQKLSIIQLLNNVKEESSKTESKVQKNKRKILNKSKEQNTIDEQI